MPRDFRNAKIPTDGKIKVKKLVQFRNNNQTCTIKNHRQYNE